MNSSLSRAWRFPPPGARPINVEASTTGPTCANAVALMVMREADGSPVFTWTGRVGDIFSLMNLVRGGINYRFSSSMP